MLSVKQRRIKYQFLSLWYDSTWDWTQVSRAIPPMSSSSNNIGCLNKHGANVTGNNSTYNIEWFNIYGAHVTANDSTNNNVVYLFCFRFQNRIL